MPKTSAAAKETSRTQILDAAVRCFARTGYYATTIEDVVRETGLSRGALYLAISERWNCGMEAAIRARLTPDLTPAAILRVLIEVNGEQVKAEADACRVLMEGWNLSHHIPVLASGPGNDRRAASPRSASCYKRASPPGSFAWISRWRRRRVFSWPRCTG